MRAGSLTHGESGYRAGCRCADCQRHHRNAYMRRYRAAHPDTVRSAYRRARAKPETIEKTRARVARYRAANQEKVRACNAAWRRRNRASLTEYDRRYRAAHPKAKKPAAPRLTRHWPFTRNAEHLDPLTAAINAAIPRSLPADVREDIAQELAVDLLTNGGTITPKAITAAVRAYWQRYPVMSGRHASLDAPAYTNDGDSRERRIDSIPDTASLAVMETDRAERMAV